MDDTTRALVSLELGRDHHDYGKYKFGAAGRMAWAISVGADEESPSRRFKGDLEVPNEDGLLAVDGDSRCLLAVADAHFGAEASHDLLIGLAAELRDDAARIPTTLAGLAELIRGLEPDDPPDYASETTLLVAVYERATRQGFGIRFGDSSFACVGPSGIRMASLEPDPTRVATGAGRPPGGPTPADPVSSLVDPPVAGGGPTDPKLDPTRVATGAGRPPGGPTPADPVSSLVDPPVAGGGPTDLEQPMRFVSPAQPGSLELGDVGESFVCAAQPGELLIAFTDGIDGCHYHHPETSVTPAIMASLYVDADAERYARAVIELALAGVDGNPGGQDNIAMIVLPA